MTLNEGVCLKLDTCLLILLLYLFFYNWQVLGGTFELVFVLQESMPYNSPPERSRLVYPCYRVRVQLCTLHRW